MYNKQKYYTSAYIGGAGRPRQLRVNRQGDIFMAAELLAPAGSRESLEAALQAGADAVYLGSGRLNARGEKAQFPPEELPEISRLIHEAGARFYLTLNILLSDEELPEALALARLARAAGADACIVQDRGLMSLLARELPEFPVHASTQCTAGTPEALRAYRALGCRRVVLPRELDLDEIARLCACARELGMETEVFVHGALCMSVSGQCHMSHFMGGRSANRGDCAQCCRMNYTIEKDGELFRQNGAWLSPKDISAFLILDKLLAAGVDSLKIEGRLRRADYVGQTTAIFRRALDELGAGLTPGRVLSGRRERDLQIAFNRGGGFNRAYWLNSRDRSFLSPDRTGHAGLLLGEVKEILPQQGIILLRPDRQLAADYVPQPHSQISLRAKAGDEGVSAPCGRIRRRADGCLELKGFHPKVLRRLHLPLSAWQMNQPKVAEQDQILRPARPLDMRLFRNAQGLFVLELKAAGRELLFAEDQLEPGPELLDRPLSAERCREQLGKLGDSPFTAGRVTVETAPAWRIRDLNALRRQALTAFAALPAPQPAEPARAARPPLSPAGTDFSGRIFYRNTAALPFWKGGPWPRCLNKEDWLLLLPLSELLRQGPEKLSAELDRLRPRPALGVLMPPQLAAEQGARIGQELRKFHETLPLAALAQGPSGLPQLARAAGLEKAALLAWQGSQIWNGRTIEALAAEGYDHFLLSPELSGSACRALAEACPEVYRERLLLWAYGRTQAMFTRFCPLGYSQGYERCRICDTGAFVLADEKGRRFPLAPRPHLNCSFEVWQSEPLEPDRLQPVPGPGQVMVFTCETEAEIERIIENSGV